MVYCRLGNKTPHLTAYTSLGYSEMISMCLGLQNKIVYICYGIIMIVLYINKICALLIR